MKQNKIFRITGGVFVVTILVAIGASMGAQGDPHNGTWTLDLAKSKYSPGPAPKNQTTVYTVTAQAVKMTSTQVTGAGGNQTTEFSANFDGKDVPVKGNADYDMTSAKRVNANGLEFTRKKAGKVVQTATSVVSADGKTHRDDHRRQREGPEDQQRRDLCEKVISLTTANVPDSRC